MAKCWDYKTDKKCPNFYKCLDEDTTVQVGTSMKKLDQFCFYCMATPGVKKIAGGADFTGRTPKWCPWAGTNEKPPLELEPPRTATDKYDRAYDSTERTKNQ